MAPPIALCDYVYMAILSLDSITYHAVRCSISQKERYATTQPTQSITNQDTFCGTCHAINYSDAELSTVQCTQFLDPYNWHIY